MIEFRKDFYADVRTEDRSRTTISYKAGVLEEMKTREERRAFLRVYDGRMWYYASVTDLAHLQKTLDGLYAAATPGDSERPRRSPLRAQPGQPDAVYGRFRSERSGRGKAGAAQVVSAASDRGRVRDHA